MVKQKIDPISTIEIEIALAKYFGVRQNLIVPNVSWGFHYSYEMDMMLISKCGYAKEIEIKISKSDFYADFKKKHNHSNKYIREFYYAMPMAIYELVSQDIPEHAGVLVCNRLKNDKIIVKLLKKAKIQSKSLKLSDADILKVSRLGTMRIWGLKAKLLKQKNIINELKNGR